MIHRSAAVELHDDGDAHPPALRCVLLLALAACGAADGGAGFVARDSAGIAIATTLPSARLPAWTLDLQPLLSIGESDVESVHV
ncbi:MAG TPA: hypothetical protein VE871_01540 [Longimicrobium sp.]|nr:hypothetical protein [Longimicrobium sp.]